LLQQQLAETLGLDENATIFEICAAINATDLEIDEIIAQVIAGLELDLVPIVEDQISGLVLTIVAAINDLLGTDIELTPEEIIDAVDIDAIIAQITANVGISLDILEACLEEIPEPPPVNCDECFQVRGGGEGIIPMGLLDQLNTYLANNAVTVGDTTDIVGDVVGLCIAIVEEFDEGTPATEEQIRAILDAGFAEGEDPPDVQRLIDRIIECLLALSPPPITPT
jgi:hypothetical protein